MSYKEFNNTMLRRQNKYLYLQQAYVLICIYKKPMYLFVFTTSLCTYLYLQQAYVLICIYNKPMYLFVFTTSLCTYLYLQQAYVLIG